MYVLYVNYIMQTEMFSQLNRYSTNKKYGGKRGIEIGEVAIPISFLISHRRKKTTATKKRTIERKTRKHRV